jgi:hypothetical protein
MLDLLLCLFVFAIGCVTVPALFWKSYKLDEKWAALRASFVNHSQNSSVKQEDEEICPSELSDLSVLGRTDDHAPPPPAAPTFTRAQLLTLYTLLRAHGVSREKARPALKEAGIPLSNDVWAAAAPPDPAAADDTQPARILAIRERGRERIIPWHDDPELEYQPPTS